MKALVASVVLALASGGAMAAKRVDLNKLDVKGLKRQYAATIASAGEPKMSHARHKQLLGLESESFLVMQSSRKSNRSVNRRYVQTYRGVPIYGDSVVVSEDAAGEVKKLFGSVVTGLDSDVASTSPRLSKPAILEIAKKAVFGNRRQAAQIALADASLVIHVAEDGHARLAYSVDIGGEVAGQPMARALVIDATNGRVLRDYDNLQTVEEGTGPGGNERTGQYEYGTDYGYLDVTKSGTTCTMENANVKTVDLNHATYYSTKTTPYSYTCSRNTHKQINGAYSPLNDAHYFGNVVFKMYDEYMGVKPIGDNKLTLRVHAGSSWQNANWDGANYVMNFGDGGSTYHPLVALDVMAHEVSHGYTQFNSGLIYENQSGGMNEAFSDIAGDTAEFFMQGHNDWLIGGTIKKVSGAMRYFADPTRDNNSIGHADDYFDGLNVHYSSGVYNKAFYTLANKAGWDIVMAFKAFASANRDYWTSGSTFDQGAAGVLQAACDLGFTGQDVIDSFDVVGVDAGALPADCGGGTPPGNTAPVADFSSSVNGLTVTFTDKSTDSDGTIASRNWNFGDGTTSTSTNPSKTYAAGGTYTVKLTVTDDDGATHIASKSVTVTAPSTGGTLTNGVAKTSLSGAAGSSQLFTLNVPAGATNLKFVSSGGTGDVDMYVKFNGTPTTTSSDCKSEGSTNAETCTISNIQAGTYTVLLYGYSAYSGVSLTGSYTAGSTATQTYTNSADVAINDNATATSTISVSGRTGTVSSGTVSVNIQHTFRGDLKIELHAPNGSFYTLKNYDANDSADNVVQSWNLGSMSTQTLNGDWKLKVTDNASNDVGKIDSWSLRF